MPIVGSRQDQANVSATIDGEATGTWDKKDGGARTADSTKYRPGNMGQPLSLGGWADTENVTLSRIVDHQRDIVSGLLGRLLSKTGRARVSISDQSLTKEGVPIGRPLVMNGTLVGVTPPERDSESNDGALLEIEVEIDGEPAG